jgi:sulfite reductase alpha subunit-like flavoprotein
MHDSKTVRLLVPRPARFVRKVKSAGQAVELNHITVSLLANGKESAEIFFDRFQELFPERFSGIKMQRFRKRIHSIPCDFIPEVASCDLVVNATAE